MKNIIYLVMLLVAFTACTESKENKPQIPIVAWYSIPAEYATAERYNELKEAGFNISFAHIYKYEDAIKALDLAAEAGIKSIFMCPELQTDPEETVKKVMNHPGLAGYFLRDEPHNKDLEDLGKWAKRIMAVDSTHYCYLNLLPLHSFGSEGYQEHMKMFNELVPIQIMSFDHYPVVFRDVATTDSEGNTVTERVVSLQPYWYENLEAFMREAKRVNKPFWAFALATAHGSYPIPEPGHIRVQLYSNLAYGAQALQYFTYWNPGTEVWNFHEAPITLNGKRNHVYDMVRDINKELQARAFVFMGGEVLSVHHTGNSLPIGTQPLKEMPASVKSLDTKGAGAVVSVIKNNNTTYLVVVNSSPTESLCLNIEFEEGVKRVMRDGTLVSASLYEPNYMLDAGYAEIFVISEDK